MSKQKLEEKQREINADIEDKANGVSEINERIGALLEEVEKAGMAGEVEKSQKVFNLIKLKLINLFFFKDNGRCRSAERTETRCRGVVPQFHAQVCSTFLIWIN